MISKTKKLIFILAVSSVTVLIITTAYSQKISSFFNLTTRINTAGDDYAPSLTKDGSTAVFNSQMPGDKSHNIFIIKNKNGLWGDPYPIFDINSDGNDETPFISADGQIIIFASDRPGGLSSSATSDGRKRITYDLYISRLVSDKWTEPELLKGTVNTSMNERAPGLSADGATLYFTRWPYNNPGKAKIYSATLDGGEFKDVKELPASINSGNYEMGFRPSYKSERYYFASRRPGGSGGWDIYYTTKSGNNFTNPINAGKDINTPYDEMFYSESEKNSILCSNKTGGYGKFDIYSSIPSAGISIPVIKETKQKSENIDTVIKNSSVKNEDEIQIQPFLKTIYFKFNYHEVPTEYITEIHRLVELMRNDSGLNILISGYTDPVGPAEVNNRLSMKRAQSVARLIKSLDIPENRITVEWFGETKASSGKTGSRYYHLDRKVELLLQK